MHLHLAVRRSLAVTAATALLTTGGAASGLLGTALAAPGDPAIASATPAADNNSGSAPTAVTINGAGFLPASDSVTFDPAPSTMGSPAATDVAPLTATVDNQNSTTTALKVTVNLTLAAPGAYNISVKQGVSNGDTCLNCFTVTSNGAPSASNVGPGASTGSTSRGARALDITGSFFATGARVTFTATGASAPDSGLGLVPGDPNKSSASSSGGYPSSGLIRGNYTLGASFTPGKHLLQVTNTDGATGAGVEFWQPLFDKAGVSPSTTGAGTTNRVVTVTGQGIRAGSSLSIQNLAGNGNPSDVTVGTATVNAAGTTISAPVSFLSTAKSGSANPRSVSINGPDGGTYSVADAFTVTPAPSITGLSSSKAGQGAIEDLAISGTGFSTDPANKPVFTFSGTGVTAVTQRVDTSTVTNPPSMTMTTVTTAIVTLTVARDAALTGRNVTVTNPDFGSFTLQPTGTPPSASPLTITAAPTVTSVMPGSSPRGTTKTIVISGSNFDATNGMDVVFSLPPAAGATRTRDTSLSVGTVTVTKGTSPALDTASFPVMISSTAPFGLRDISLLNKGDSGTYLCAGCFGVDSLTVSPAAASNTGTKSLTFSVAGIPSGSTVQLIRSGDPAYQPHLTGANPVVASDSSSMTALFDLTAAAPGAYNAIVSQGSTVLTCSGCFTVTGSTPTLTSVTPSTGGQGALNRALTLAGTNFSRGEQITIAGLSVHDVAFVSPTQLTALVDIPANAATGALDVVVTNADGVGTGTLSKGFTVTAAPAVSSVSPTSLGQGAKSQDITVTGPGFAGDGTATAPTSSVSFGPGVTVTKVVVTQGMAVPGINPNPADTLTATVTVLETAAVGARDVVVTNPDGGSGTLPKGFTVNAGPKVSSVTPAALAPGSYGKTLTIAGSNFSTTSGKTAVPTIAGVNLTNPVVSADGTTITATATAAAGQAKGTPDVVVTNPTDQGVGTCPACFAIATPPAAPTGVTAQGSGTQVVVTWTAPTDNGGSPITSYVVSATGPDGKAAGNPVTVDGKTTTATLTGLTSGTVYTVSVIARNAAGDSPAATAKSTANGVPTAPTATATAGDSKVTVGYSGANASGSPITGYTIYITNGATTTTQSAPAGSSSAVVTGLTNGTTYSFAVSAKNANGEGAKSAAVTATPVKGAQTPVTITTANGSPIAGQKTNLTVTGAPGAAYDVVAANRPSSTFELAHRGTLDANGRSVFEVHPLNNVNFIARSGGVSSSQVVLSVHTALNIAVKRVGSGHVLTFTGQIYPNNRSQPVYIKTGNETVGRATRDASGRNWTFTHDFSAGAGRTVVFYSYTISDTQNANGHSRNLAARL